MKFTIFIDEDPCFNYFYFIYFDEKIKEIKKTEALCQGGLLDYVVFCVQVLAHRLYLESHCWPCLTTNWPTNGELCLQFSAVPDIWWSKIRFWLRKRKIAGEFGTNSWSKCRADVRNGISRFQNLCSIKCMPKYLLSAIITFCGRWRRRWSRILHHVSIFIFLLRTHNIWIFLGENLRRNHSHRNRRTKLGRYQVSTANWKTTSKTRQHTPKKSSSSGNNQPKMMNKQKRR